MVDITTHKLATRKVRLVEEGALFSMRHSFALSAGNDGDYVIAFALPANVRILDAILTHDATLGAGCVLALYHDDGSTKTALTGDTTAAGASTVRMTAAAMNADKDDTIEVEIETANVAATANVYVDVICERI